MTRTATLKRAGVVVAAVVAAGALLAVLALAVAVYPWTSPPIGLVVVIAAVAASRRAASARVSAVIAAAVAIGAFAVLVALSPQTAALSALGVAAAISVGNGAWNSRAALRRFALRAARPLAALAAACAALALVVAIATWPASAAIGAASATALAAAWAARGPIRRTAARAARPLLAALAVAASAGFVLALVTAVATWPAPAALVAVGAVAVAAAAAVRDPIAHGAVVAARVLAAVAAVAVIALAVALYPASAALVIAVAGVLVLAWRRPALGLAAAVLLFGFEGSVKILLGLESTPLPGGNRAAGAAALDIALFGALAAVLLRDRLRTPRAAWQATTRAERGVICVIGAWLVLSALQILQGGDPSRGLHGFRLFQAYTLVALASLTIFARPQLRTKATRAALVVALVVSAYAAARVVIGMSGAERDFALASATVTIYGHTVRAIGSFTSAIGLGSFMAPLAAFALVLGLLMPRMRRLAWTVGLLAVIGLIGSYSRSSLFGVALGLACGVLVVFFAADMPGRRKLVSGVLAVAIAAGGYGGLLAASQASPALRERARGVLNPIGDESVKLRFQTWRRNFDDALSHPLGQGVGAVGAASAPDPSTPNRVRVRTTDNSFLKILVEQGVLGLALFAAGMVAAVVLLARRIRRVPSESRPLGFAALAGFVSFLGLSISGESVEQPGKVVAWGLLGIAAAVAFTPAHEELA